MIKNNKFYLVFFITLCTFTFLLNYYNNIPGCALVSVFIYLILNSICELYGIKVARISIVSSLLFSLILKWDMDYYTSSGYFLKNLVIVSLISIGISSYIGLYILNNLKYNFIARNFISIISSVIIDGLTMALFLFNQLPTKTLIITFEKEVSYKSLYIAIGSIFILFGYNIIEIIKQRINNHHR